MKDMWGTASDWAQEDQGHGTEAEKLDPMEKSTESGSVTLHPLNTATDLGPTHRGVRECWPSEALLP